MSPDVFMAAAHLVAILILAAAVSEAQSAPACPANRPIDDVMAEMNKQKPPRNKNPLPDTACLDIWLGAPVGRCREIRKKPAEQPAGQPAHTEPTDTQDQSSADQASSAKTPAEKCNEAMEKTLEAAHDVEVGDESFGRKNYKGALLRYQDAAELKPDDDAIHVRLGRVFEQVNQPNDAIEQYKLAQQLGGPEKYVKEAASALARLQHAAR